MWKTISDENPVTDGPLLLFTHIVGANVRPAPTSPPKSGILRFLCHRERPCKSRSSTHLPNFENGLRKITIVPPRYGWVFTTSALTKEVLPTVRHWTKLYVLDGLTEYARASTKPPINSGSLREDQTAIGAQSISGGRMSWQGLAECRPREQKHSSNGPAILGSILSSLDLRNCLLSISGSSKQTGRHGSSSGPRLRGTSGHPPSGL
jgi:hypothetical protein